MEATYALPAAVEVHRIPLSCDLSPQDAFLALRDEPWPFALVGRWAGGGAILGCRPLTVIGRGEDPFELLDRLPALRGAAAEDAVGGGWFGWLGYGLGARIERLSPQPPRPRPLPDAHLAYYDHVVRCDAAGRWWLEALAPPDGAARLEARLEELRRKLAAPPQPAPSATPGPFEPVAPGAPGHLAAVRRCIERIRAGEIFQANLRMRLESEWDGDLAELFARVSRAAQPAYGAAFITPAGGIASVSPELFLRRSGDAVETAPIKGTAPLPRSPGAAAAARESLLASAKDGAEHVMIVDVARNDLGRVCEPGTIEAPSAPFAEEQPGLLHLVSRVRGTLRPGVGNAELVRAAFPPASVTGAPKIQAMQVIAELEASGREAYTGAIGFSSPASGLELNVAIRTFEASQGRLWLDVGGGIVADSDPERELEECLVKARPPIDAAGGAIRAEGRSPQPPRRRAADPAPPPALSAAMRRPDPALGVLETILVEDGRPLRAGAHLARLAASLRALYGTDPPADLGRRLAEAAASLESGGLRIRAGADGEAEIEIREPASRPEPVPLRPLTLPGGLGPHKWADRRLVDALSAGGATPLFVDGDGSVLEAGWANVWIVEGDRLLTPPADGRILPGVTRAELLEGTGTRGEAAGRAAEAAEETITLARLERADAILLSASLSGLVPARLSA